VFSSFIYHSTDFLFNNSLDISSRNKVEELKKQLELDKLIFRGREVHEIVGDLKKYWETSTTKVQLINCDT